MKYRTKSADVLNDADRFERILSWTLHTLEQENMLWHNPHESKWKPGIPMYKDPRYLDFGVYTDPNTPDDYYEWEGPPGNHARPMIEEMIDGNAYSIMRCKPCGVSSHDDVCWMCGEKYPTMGWEKLAERVYTPGVDHGVLYVPTNDFRSAYEDQSRVLAQAFDVEETEHGLRAYITFNLEVEMGPDWRAMMNRMMEGFSVAHERTQEIAVATDRAREAFSGAQEAYRNALNAFTIYDEASQLDAWPSELLEESLYGLADVPDQFTSGAVELPANWADLRPPVPLPEMPGPRDYSDDLPLRSGPPTTPTNRRNRR